MQEQPHALKDKDNVRDEDADDKKRARKGITNCHFITNDKYIGRPQQQN